LYDLYNITIPISLKPLKFDEAVSDLLKVNPEKRHKKLDVEKSNGKN
jgi:hypothetical protein